MRRILILTIMISLITISNTKAIVKWNYKREIICNFIWGSENGQLGTDYFNYYDDSGKYIGNDDASSEVEGPSALAIGSDNAIYICDARNRRIIKYDENGSCLEQVDINIYSRAMALDKNGNLFVEYRGNRIKIYDKDLNEIRSINYGPYNFIAKKMWIDEDKRLIYMYGNLGLIEVNYLDQDINNIVNGHTISGKPSKLTKDIIHAGKDEYIVIFPSTKKTIKIQSKDIPDIDFLAPIIEMSNLLYTEARLQYKSKYRSSLGIIDQNGQLFQGPIFDLDDKLYYFQEQNTYLIVITKDNDIFHLCIRKNGPVLIRWRCLR